MSLSNGRFVSYMGAERDGAVIGDQGKVVEADHKVAHVMWTTGARAGTITAQYIDDLSPHGIEAVNASLDDSLTMGSLVTFSARRSYDIGGEAGVLNAMAETGHLAAFGEIAEEALALISNRIRHDASFRAATAELDYDEAEDVIRLASFVLIRDAYGDGDESE